jgi:hypothetical protein
MTAPDRRSYTLVNDLMRIEVNGGLWITGTGTAVHPAGVVVDTPR